MKKIIAILLLICTLTLCLASCGGGSNDKELSPEAIADIRESLFLKTATLKSESMNLSTSITMYNLYTMTKDEYKADSAYSKARGEFDELLSFMKEILDYYNEYSNCFNEDTANSIAELEKIYNEILESKKITSSEKAYVSLMDSTCDKISDWEYVSTKD